MKPHSERSREDYYEDVVTKDPGCSCVTGAFTCPQCVKKTQKLMDLEQGRKAEIVYMVAVWWKKEGAYGLPTEHATIDSANERKTFLESPYMGYGKPGTDSEVHIWSQPKDMKTVRLYHYRGRPLTVALEDAVSAMRQQADTESELRWCARYIHDRAKGKYPSGSLEMGDGDERCKAAGLAPWAW